MSEILRSRSAPIREIAALLAACLLLGTASRAAADGPIGPNGSTITTSDYALDLFHGPVFAGSRVTGLAGSYVAISEDVDGDLQNPAAPAVRPFFSYSHFDYWLGFGLTFPATLSDTDFFNSGSKTNIANSPDSFVFFTPAVNLQWGEFGVGLNLEVQQYALSKPTEEEEEQTGKSISATIPTMHLQFARGIHHNQLVLGVGMRLVSMWVRDSDNRARTLFSSNGAGLEFGGVYKPENLPFRVGLSFRTAIRTEPSYSDSLLPDADGDLIIENPGGAKTYLPEAVAFPWDLNFGVAWQFGARQLNPPWRMTEELAERETLQHRLREIDRERAKNEAMARVKTEEERAEIERVYEEQQIEDDKQLDRALDSSKRIIETALINMNRFYVQVSVSMLVSGPVEDAVGVESLVSQTVNRSGQYTVVSPRLGVEASIFPTWLKVRGGTYLEPTRFEGSKARLHGTFGLDVKLAVWNVFGLWPDDYMWRLGLGADLTSRYYTWGITIAGWYPRHSEPDKFTKPLE
ncbi:MAG TPA: hypothetical protein VJV78_32260 [Polyangiales bacterium]|nr:hypothetical protein [Polyangiales bacterium]